MEVIPDKNPVFGINTNVTTEVLKRHDKQVVAMARRFKHQTEDLAQVGRMALLEAHQVWQQKEHHAQFWTFAYVCVFRAMLKYVTREREIASVRSTPPESAGASPDVVVEAIEHLSTLTPEQRDIVLAHIAGQDVRSIASETGSAKSTVYDHLTAAMETIRRRA